MTVYKKTIPTVFTALFVARQDIAPLAVSNEGCRGNGKRSLERGQPVILSSDDPEKRSKHLNTHSQTYSTSQTQRKSSSTHW